MLPCNVLIYERQNKTVVSIIKPKVAMKMIGNIELEQIASSIEKKFRTPYPQKIKVTPSKGHFPSFSGFGVRKTFHKNI